MNRREHHAGHEQHVNQRHAADQLDVADAQQLHQRQGRGTRRPSATSTASGKARLGRRWPGSASSAGRPIASCPDVGQAGEAAPHQQADERSACRPQIKQSSSASARTGAWRTGHTGRGTARCTMAGPPIAGRRDRRPNRMKRHNFSPITGPAGARDGCGLREGPADAEVSGPVRGLAGTSTRRRVQEGPVEQSDGPADQQIAPATRVTAVEKPSRRTGCRAQPTGPHVATEAARAGGCRQRRACPAMDETGSTWAGEVAMSLMLIAAPPGRCARCTSS